MITYRYVFLSIALASFCFPFVVHAQLCTGSLGDPIVNIDFGAGTGRGAALGSSVTAFTYKASGELGEGEYTIANTTAGLKGGAWYVTTDHTGNTNGYMMVINSAVLASEGIFYTKTVSGLCPNTTYEFSGWLMNIMNPSAGTDQHHPKVTFSVSSADGTVLGSYSTGDIPQTSTPTWNQYGFYFSTGSETSVVIKMYNSAASAVPGNDIALDDIKFRPCGPMINASIAGSGTSSDICVDSINGTKLVSTVSGGYTNPSYQWQISTDAGSTWTDITGATTATYVIKNLTAGSYLYRLAVASGSNISSSSCRIVSDNLTINVKDKPTANASSNNPTCFGDTLQLSVTTSESNASFKWIGPGNFSSTNQDAVIQQVNASNSGWYYITVTTSAGCVSKDSLKITLNSNPAADAGSDLSVCEGSSITLDGTGTGSNFSWSPGNTLSDSLIAQPTASPTATTTYILSVSNGTCKTYDTTTVNVWKKPVADAGADKYMLENSSVQLSGSASGSNISYSWSPLYNISSAASLTPTVSPASDTTYTLTVTSGYGCGSATDNVKVYVYKNLTIPNAFSPNGDGINDTWTIKQISSYSNASVMVFNRYGQIVFKSRGYTKEWDGMYAGKPLPVGTYYYVIDLKTTIPLRFNGWVVLLR